MSSKRKERPQKVPSKVPGVQQMIAGPGPTIECGGQTWRLGFNNQNAKGRLEELIRAHVLREARANRDALRDEEGEAEYQESRATVSGGYYRTFADGWRTILRMPAGRELFILSLLQQHHPEATVEDVRTLLAYDADQVEDAVTEISPDFFRALAEQVALEQKQSPADAKKAAREIEMETRKKIAEEAARREAVTRGSTPTAEPEPDTASVTSP